MSKNRKFSPEYLLKKLDADIRMFHTQLEFLKISFKNLQGSWWSAFQAYKVFKDEMDEDF